MKPTEASEFLQRLEQALMEDLHESFGAYVGALPEGKLKETLKAALARVEKAKEDET